MNDFDDVACVVTVDRGMLVRLCSINIGEERFHFPHTLHTWFLAGQVCPDWCEGLPGMGSRPFCRGRGRGRGRGEARQQSP